jgi:hypothetical protein
MGWPGLGWVGLGWAGVVGLGWGALGWAGGLWRQWAVDQLAFAERFSGKSSTGRELINEGRTAAAPSRAGNGTAATDRSAVAGWVSGAMAWLLINSRLLSDSVANRAPDAS